MCPHVFVEISFLHRTFEGSNAPWVIRSGKLHAIESVAKYDSRQNAMQSSTQARADPCLDRLYRDGDLCAFFVVPWSSA